MIHDEYFLEVRDNQAKLVWLHWYRFSGLPPNVQASLSPPPPNDQVGDIFKTFDVADLADVRTARLEEGLDDGYGPWRFERWLHGIDFHPESPVPLNPLIVGFVVGDLEIEDVNPSDLKRYLGYKLSTLIQPVDNGSYRLARDPLQDAFFDTRPHDVDSKGRQIHFRYLAASAPGDADGDSEAGDATIDEEDGSVDVEGIQQALGVEMSTVVELSPILV